MIYSFVSIMIKDFKLIIRNKQVMIISFIFPFLIFFLFSTVFSNLMNRESIIDPLKVAVVDNEDSTLSKMLISNFKGYKSFSNMVNIEVLSYAEAEKQFKTGQLTAVLEIPNNFSESLFYMENAPLKVTLNKYEPLKSLLFKDIMHSYGKFVTSVEIGSYSLDYYVSDLGISSEERYKYNEEFSIKLIFTALSRGSMFNLINYENVPSCNSIEYFLVALFIVFLMYMGLTSANLIIHEKNTRCLYRFAASPSSSFMLVLSKCIAFTVFCTVQLLVFTLPILYLSHIELQGIGKNLLIFLVLSILLIVSIFILISTFFQSEEASILLGNIGIFICSIVGGSFIPLQLMPSAIQSISKLTPNYWIIRGTLYLYNGYPLYYIYTTAAVFLIIIALSIAVSSIRLKHKGVLL